MVQLCQRRLLHLIEFIIKQVNHLLQQLLPLLWHMLGTDRECTGCLHPQVILVTPAKSNEKLEDLSMLLLGNSVTQCGQDLHSHPLATFVVQWISQLQSLVNIGTVPCVQ